MNRRLSRLPILGIAFVASAAGLYAGFLAVGAVSVATQWRVSEWGADGWPFTTPFTVALAAALFVLGAGLQYVLTRWISALLLVTVFLSVLFLGVIVAVLFQSGTLALLLVSLVAALLESSRAQRATKAHQQSEV